MLKSVVIHITEVRSDTETGKVIMGWSVSSFISFFRCHMSCWAGGMRITYWGSGCYFRVS